MSHWETNGKSDEWYTPRYIFDALNCTFDLDPANAAIGGAHVPCALSYGHEGLTKNWRGFVWLNPPFGGRNGIVPWLERMAQHGNGIALVPDRTSAPWFQDYASRAKAALFISPKVKFERPDGTRGESPSTGTALLGYGERAADVLRKAAPELGLFVRIGNQQ